MYLSTITIWENYEQNLKSKFLFFESRCKIACSKTAQQIFVFIRE